MALSTLSSVLCVVGLLSLVVACAEAQGYVSQAIYDDSTCTPSSISIVKAYRVGCYPFTDDGSTLRYAKFSCDGGVIAAVNCADPGCSQGCIALASGAKDVCSQQGGTSDKWTCAASDAELPAIRDGSVILRRHFGDNVCTTEGYYFIAGKDGFCEDGLTVYECTADVMIAYDSPTFDCSVDYQSNVTTAFGSCDTAHNSRAVGCLGKSSLSGPIQWRTVQPSPPSAAPAIANSPVMPPVATPVAAPIASPLRAPVAVPVAAPVAAPSLVPSPTPAPIPASDVPPPGAPVSRCDAMARHHPWIQPTGDVGCCAESEMNDHVPVWKNPIVNQTFSGFGSLAQLTPTRTLGICEANFVQPIFFYSICSPYKLKFQLQSQYMTYIGNSTSFPGVPRYLLTVCTVACGAFNPSCFPSNTLECSDSVMDFYYKRVSDGQVVADFEVQTLSKGSRPCISATSTLNPSYIMAMIILSLVSIILLY